MRQLDTELGETKFNVVMVFVDPQERVEDLLRWKTDFGGADWYYVLDTAGFAESWAVKYLDTKYTLDSDGRVLDLDTAVVDAVKYRRLLG